MRAECDFFISLKQFFSFAKITEHAVMPKNTRYAQEYTNMHSPCKCIAIRLWINVFLIHSNAARLKMNSSILHNCLSRWACRWFVNYRNCRISTEILFDRRFWYDVISCFSALDIHLQQKSAIDEFQPHAKLCISAKRSEEI